MKNYMFDTNAFNRLCDEKVDILSLKKDNKFYVTHLQLDEIRNTKDKERRIALLKTFQELNSDKVATESAIWDVSRWDEAKWSDEANGNLYATLLKALEQKKPRDGERNIRDALMAETCIKNKFILVTDDNALLETANKLGCNILTWNDFLVELGYKESASA